jgi:undecaprenyl-diphosphatase
LTAPTDAHRGHPTRGGTLYAAATLTIAFVVLAILVALRWQPLGAFDTAADTALHPYVLQDPGLRRAVVAVTNAGSPVSVDVVTVIAAGLLLRAHRVAMAVYVVATRLLELAIETAAKHLIARPRPHFLDPVGHASSFSFPSGHTAGTAALCMSLIVVAHQLTRTRTSTAATLSRICAVLFVILAISAVGASRILLGVHYPSDVLGGGLLGIACALALAPITQCPRPGDPRAPSTATPSDRT